MSDAAEELAALEEGLAGLEGTIGATTLVTRAFQAELGAMQRGLGQVSKEMDWMSRSFGSGLRRAFDGLVFDGMRASEALQAMGRTLVQSVYNRAMRPVQNAVGASVGAGLAQLLGGALFADGAAFSQGRVTPFARGGVISQATAFPMRGGLGLMGEAGPEAIMPLARGPDGRLGVRSDGGTAARPVQITMNISTPDAGSFARTETQIAARLSRLLGQSARVR